MSKRHLEIGACGLDCILCPRHFTKGRSRCERCGSEYSYAAVGCKLYRCCVSEKGLETCAACEDFPCPKLQGATDADSFVTHRMMISNLRSIARSGIDEYLREQDLRRDALERMLSEFNDGRSKSYYCLAARLLSVEALVDALNKATGRARDEGGEGWDRAKMRTILKDELDAAATREGVDLLLRRTEPRKRRVGAP
jgi:hypothetical protein